jgi:hypothetical protein
LLVSVAEVQARWGYSEILDGTLANCYDHGHDTTSLRDKRRNGVPFEGLTEDDKYSLAFRSSLVRVNLMPYLAGIEQFALVEIDRAQLGKFLVPPNVWRDSQGQFYPFAHYITTTTNEAGDARTIAIDPKDFRPSVDPITIGRSYQFAVLIDGYHRAAVFWKYGPGDGRLLAYVPLGLVI